MGVVNFWFFKRASDAEQNQSWYYFRMVEPDFTPLPVYEAMREYTANLTPTLYLGDHQEDHWALEYTSALLSAGTGNWETIRDTTATLGAYRRTTTPGDTLRFTFEGASLTLAPGPGAGEVEVSVDGNAPRRFSLDGQPVRLVSGWRQERHQVTLTAVSGEISIDDLIVQRPWSPSPWLVLGAVGLLVLLVVTTLVVLRRR